MAWQGEVAPTVQIAAKAALKPAGRNLALKAIRQRFSPNHTLAGLLSGLAPIFKRRITCSERRTAFAKVA
jgi:hypothetical protein